MVSRQILPIAVLLMTASGFISPVRAQVPARAQVAVRAQVLARDTLRLAEVVAETRHANPGLRAARYRADAAAERVPQAGALPDPMLSLGLRNRPVDDFGTDPMMTMNWIGLSQQFPWPGIQGFSEERERRLARAAELDADEVEAFLIARVTTVYYRLAYLDRAVMIMTDTRELLRDFLDVTTARYAVGKGPQQDILQAQVAIARMTADITVVTQDRIAMAARLNSLLGRPATEPVGALELPDPHGAMASVDSLMQLAARNRPAIQAARERALAAESGYRAAQRDAHPDFNVRIGYGQRPQFVDLVTLEVGISLPVWSGSKQKPRQLEMLAFQAMEEAKQLDLYNETYARLSELRAASERSWILSELYRTSIIPQAQAAVESALSAYRVGEVDYMTLLANQMTVNRFKTERVRLSATYQDAVAGIQALTDSSTRNQP